MNIDILLGREKIQEPPVIECRSRDCANCKKTADEQYNCESKAKMHDYLRHVLGDVSFSSAVHMGKIEELRINFDKMEDLYKTIKESQNGIKE